MRGTVDVVQKNFKVQDSSDVVVWLTPLHSEEPVEPGPKVRLLQKSKRFTPHLLVVKQGTQIDFPNEDPFFHNVFSIYRGRPFDLGLYESGTTKSVRFTQPGASYIFCNIHPEMSAVVLVLKTSHFAQSAKDGSFQIANIPPGRYKLEIWYERATEDELNSFTKEVEIKDGENKLNTITLHSTSEQKEHLNKYGEPYDKPTKTKY